MCNSYCNSCSYCVSQCTCSNPTLVTPASIPATGCISTNYARCIYYSGNNISCGSVNITNGQSLDVVVKTLSDSICNITPADLAWGTFNYQCLREDGSLTGSGPSNITTGKEFAEAVSIALCTLATAADITPNITISGPCSAYFAGLTPGTSTLVDILDDFIVKLCSLNAQNDTSTVTTACSAGTWTSVPAFGSTLGTWVNWIKSNVCSLVTTVQARVTSLETFETNLKIFVGDPTLSLIDNSASCISGSGSDSLLTTIGLIKSKLCAIDSTVATYPNFAAITLPWTTCPGLFPSYSPTASLTTQLTRIVNEIAARTYSFSADFTTTSTSCGTVVGLASPGGGFTCSDLNSCSIQNLGDVDSTFTPASQFAVLSWNGTQWTSKTISLISASGSCAITSVASPNLTFNVDFTLSPSTTLDNTILTPVQLNVGTPVGGVTPVDLKYNSDFFVGTPTLATWNFAAPTAVLAVANSLTGPPTTLNTMAPYVSGRYLELEGQIDLVVSGPGLAAGTQYVLGGAVVAIPIPPGPFAQTWNSGFSLMDNATNAAFPIYLGHASGVISIFTLAAVPTGTYTLSVGGTRFRIY
jgi:hypothetical protein